jgi:hypothetical protein
LNSRLRFSSKANTAATFPHLHQKQDCEISAELCFSTH